MSLERLLIRLYTLVLFMAAFMPGHRLLGVPITTVSVALFVGAAVAYIIAYKPHISAGLGVAVICFGLAMFVWMAVALSNPQISTKSMMNEFDGFMLSSIVIFGTYFMLDQRLVDVGNVFYAAMAGCLLFGTLKVLAIFGIVTGITDWGTVTERLDKFMDYDLISDPITTGFFRFEFPNDSVGPFMIAFLLFHDRFNVRLNPWVKWIGVGISAVTVLFSFSRYLWALSVAGALIGAVSFRSPRLILGMILLGMVIFAVNPDVVLQWYGLRFNSSENNSSDFVRSEQLKYLPQEVARRPVMGKGFGGSASEILRDEEHPFDYEVQWLAYLMNFGFAGVGVMLVYFLAVFRRLASNRVPHARLFLTLLFLSLLVGAFTNPYLMGPPFAVVVSLLVAGATPAFPMPLDVEQLLPEAEPMAS